MSTLVRVDEETKGLIDEIRKANKISANEVIRRMLKREDLTPPKSQTSLNPNDEYRMQCLEAAFANRGINPEKELEIRDSKEKSNG